MKVTTFLMFSGKAEEALRFYVSLLPNSAIDSLVLNGPEEPGAGTVKHALVTLAGTKVMAIDSHVQHAFTFTPATSLFVEVDSLSQLEHLNTALSAGGQVLMPLGNYGFSQSFAWVQDRWGVSWQLNLPL